MGDLSNRNLLFHSSASWKSKVQAQLVSAEASLLGLQLAAPVFSPHMAVLLCLCTSGVPLCPKFPLLIKTPVGLD